MFDAVQPDDPKHRVFYRLVGHFIASWAHAEWNLAFLTQNLLKSDLERTRMILAAQINFRAKREFILRLGRSYLLDEDLPAFETAMARVKHLSEKRNMLAHRRFYYMGKSTFRFFSDEDPTQPNTWGRYQDVQLGTIRAWIKELEVLTAELSKLWRATHFGKRLVTPSRLIPEPIEDRSPSDDPDPSGGEELPPQPGSSPAK